MANAQAPKCGLGLISALVFHTLFTTDSVMPRTTSLEHTVLISMYEQNIYQGQHFEMKCAFSWNFCSLEAICSLISNELFELQTALEHLECQETTESS